MKKIIFLCILFFNICITAFCDEMNMLFFGENFIKKLERTFCEHLEKTTGRKGILVVIERKVIDKEIVLSPSKRNEREMLLSLRIGKEKGIYQVQGSWFPMIPEETILGLLKEEIGKEKFCSSLQKEKKRYGIVKVPCANIYVNPLFEEGDNLASQVLYGVPVLVLEKHKDFFRIRAEQDGYIGWMYEKDIEETSKETWEKWQNYPKLYPEGGIDSFLPGSTLAFVDNACFSFDSIEGKGEKIQEGISTFSPGLENILRIARKFMEKEDWKKTTYLWGGASIPKLDCSGFVQTVFRMNHILLPRDSDQQYQFSTPVQKEHLKKGDLVFFSKHGRHPTHVGIYLGDNLYIHCSPAGDYSGIKINRFTGESAYEKLLDSMYYASGRILK